MRHTQRNPQKSPADPVPDPKKIVKPKNIIQKGESGSGKPKQSYVSLQERLVTEHVHFDNIEPNITSEEIILEIHKSPCSSSSPLDLSPKKSPIQSIIFLCLCHPFHCPLLFNLPVSFHLSQSWQANRHPRRWKES